MFKLEDLARPAFPSLEPLEPFPARPASAPCPPPVDLFGWWRGESGAILRFGKSGAQIEVDGTALDQKVRGQGAVEGDRLKLKLFLQSERIEVVLDLKLPTSDVLADYLSGTASKAGEEREAVFHRLGADPEGSWREGEESSLTFSAPVLDWLDGEQKVQAKVSGAIFGRAGAGQLTMSARHVFGTLEAADWSHYNRALDRRPFMRQESYERDCPREGWWGTDTLFLSLNIGPDGTFMAGRVGPLRRRDGKKIESHVHLERVVRSASAPRRSLL
jgi:hypothetical protein